MDPNNNQPVEANPIQQPVAPQPAVTPPVQPAAPVAPQNATDGNPKKGMGKGIILIVILLLLVLGMAGYIMFAKSQLDKTQKAPTNNTSSALPTPSPTASPTPLPENDLEISSPEADIIDIEADVKGL